MNTLMPWPRFQTRRVDCLDGTWEFAFLGEVDPDALDTARLPVPLPDRMTVPWAFDASPAYAGKRGVAVYRLQVAVPAFDRARVDFGAVSMLSVVYVDGRKGHRNGGGFTPYSVDLPPAKETLREIVVAVDNRFDPARIPLHARHYDFYQWGGILRSVYLHRLPRVSLDAVQVTTLDAAKGRISVAIRLGGDAPSVTLAASFDGGSSRPLKADFKDGLATVEMKVPDAKVWSPRSPQLHTLRITLESGDSRDDLITRFGLRTVRAETGKILLNGESIQLLGYNRHESHPQFGPSLPHAQILADLQHLREMGCNFVRGCHYPQDPRFLDLCDEMGILVWEESLGWQNTQAQFEHPDFRRQHLEMIAAMIDRSFNHPSILLWGFLNECASDKEWARPVYEESAALVRRLDPSRLVTYASHRPDDDLCYDLCDVVSQNLYPGWYGDPEVDDRLALIVPKLQRCREDLNRRGHGLKPYILSEIGAEAIYGWRDPLNNFYTEDFQAAYLDTVCAEVVGHPYYAGLALWHFADARTYTGEPAMRRPRCFNNKGTLDEYRRPKAAYAVVRRHFRKAFGLSV